MVNPKNTNLKVDPAINVGWVTFGTHEGPLHRGQAKYNPSKPWGVWTPIVGVIARCEGNFDTVIGYDGTGITFGIGQWTMKTGRVQRFIEFLKSVPCEDSTLFDVFCVDLNGNQIFMDYGFKIEQGQMVDLSNMKRLNPNVDYDRIVNICEGANTRVPRKNYLDLVRLFVAMGSDSALQAAQENYFKIELKQALQPVRPALQGFGTGTINDLLSGLWETPGPALFFNLWQNSPGGAFNLYKNAWTTAGKQGLANNTTLLKPENAPQVFEIIWKLLNQSSYADWGFQSKRYIESGGKNPPRIMQIQPAISEFYGVQLPYIR